MSISVENVVIGLIIGMPSFYLALQGYKRWKKADIIAEATGSTAQIYAAMNQIADNLRTDNNDIRVRVGALQVSLDNCVEAREVVEEKLRKVLQEKRIVVRERNNLIRENGG
jgi:hypothetical protein